MELRRTEMQTNLAYLTQGDTGRDSAYLTWE
jgi:hypothetical protein